MRPNRGCAVDFEASTVQHALMAQEEDPGRASRPLAVEAEPLRLALGRYFRGRVTDEAEVDDLVQEVFTRLVMRASDRPVQHIGNYVFQTAASVLADRHRRRAVRHSQAHVAFNPERHAGQDLDPLRILSGKEDLRAATAALLSLPERTRAIFLLVRLDGCRQRDVARQLGISISSVEKHLARAIQYLSERMGDQP
jgi:RNA polymerase sigma factor (sigma-70 family)